MKIAVVGATGLVGGKMLKVLAERGFGQEEILAAASPKSIGKEIPFCRKMLKVMSVSDAIAQHPDYALFSAGAGTSREYAPQFAAVGTTVIDNSSAWRKVPEIPLVVPEINADVIRKSDRIIANPNCSTIQMVLALSRLHLKYHIKRLVVSTYQSVSGTGQKAIRQLEAEEKAWGCDGKAENERDGGKKEKCCAAGNESVPMAYPYPIHRNLFPHGGDFQEDGYTTEEQKLVDETRKILRAPEIAITATVARVPVTGGHSEAVNVEFETDFDLKEVVRLLEGTPGVIVQDNPAENLYPMPLYAEDKDEVFVGRIRRDYSQPNTLNLWVVADNLRKGAATNAVQILEYLTKG